MAEGQQSGKPKEQVITQAVKRQDEDLNSQPLDKFRLSVLVHPHLDRGCAVKQPDY